MRGWQIDRHIPIAVIITLVLQTVSFVWYAARQDYKIDEHEKALTLIAQQLPVRAERISRLEERTVGIKEQISRVEIKVDKLVSRQN